MKSESIKIELIEIKPNFDTQLEVVCSQTSQSWQDNSLCISVWQQWGNNIYLIYGSRRGGDLLTPTLPDVRPILSGYPARWHPKRNAIVKG